MPDDSFSSQRGSLVFPCTKVLLDKAGSSLQWPYCAIPVSNCAVLIQVTSLVPLWALTKRRKEKGSVIFVAVFSLWHSDCFCRYPDASDLTYFSWGKGTRAPRRKVS
jgi:hypothetical protein